MSRPRRRVNFLVAGLLLLLYCCCYYASASITYDDKVETQDAVFESVHGNCPGNFLLAAPYFCSACGANGEATTLDECAKYCLEQGHTCRGFTVSSADGKCYPKTIDSCASPQQNGINLFYAKKPKSALQIYNFTIDEVNPGQPATAHCLVSGFPPPTQASAFRFEYSNGTKIPGEIHVNLLTNSAVEASLQILNVHESGQYVLCSVATDGGRASEWALTHVFALPVISEPPQIVDADIPTHRLVRWRQFAEGDIGDGPVDNYYVYIRKESEDWGIYGKTEIPTVVACQAFSPCQKKIGPLQLNTRYAVSVAAIREGHGGVGKMSPVTIFKTPCENITNLAVPPAVLLDPTSPGHVIVTWDRAGEDCLAEDEKENRVIGYRVLLTSLSTGWTVDTNVSVPRVGAVCHPITPTLPANNCSSIHFFDLAPNSVYDVALVRISQGERRFEVRTKPVRFKTPCGKPYAKVINIHVAEWFRLPNTNVSSMVLAWSPIAAKDTGCDSVDRYFIRIFDRHPSTQGAFAIRNLTVSGQESNVTVTRLFVNVPYYVVISYKNNEQIDSSPSELIPFRLEPEAAQASSGPLPGIDLTLLIGLVVGAVVLTIVLTGLVIFIVMKGKHSSFASDTDSPPSNRKSSVSSTADIPPNPNGVYINVNGQSNGGAGHHTSSNGHHHQPPPHGYDDHHVVGDSEMVLSNGNAAKVKKSRRRSSQELNSNAMYSKAVRHSTSSSNGHVEAQDEAVYNTRLDAAIGQQKF